MSDRRRLRVLITSALPYINGVKHLGNLVGSMLPADVFARYARLRGDDVLYICATDEHGTPAELAAFEAGQDVEEYCRDQWQIQKDLGDRWRLSFDHFGRSSSPQNRELTTHFFERLDASGHIAERTTKQMYSVEDGRYLPDRYIIGTCPHCGFERARGDQCENCTRVLEPVQLLNPRSATSGSTVLEMRETKHLYLQLTDLQETLRTWIESKTDWPLLTTSIAHKWLNEGLRERAITRDLKWGFPVPRPGFEDKVFYVWFDAPIEYIGATAEWADAGNDRDWKSWWYEADDVHYLQFMGKDNVPFHTIMWPGQIFGTGEPWKQADFVKAYNWLTYDGGKFSTSQHRGIFMDDALELLPPDYWRWYLMANAPESDDSDFTWPAFAAQVNKDLAGTLGNFVNRLKLSEKNFGLQVPAGGTPGAPEKALAADLARRIAAFNDYCARVEFRKAAAELYLIWSAGNVYITQQEPWRVIKTDRDQAAMILRTSINLVRIFAILAQPFIPDSAGAILESLQLDAAQQAWLFGTEDLLEALPPGHEFTIPEILFARISDEQVEEWTARFGGAAAVV